MDRDRTPFRMFRLLFGLYLNIFVEFCKAKGDIMLNDLTFLIKVVSKTQISNALIIAIVSQKTQSN